VKKLGRILMLVTITALLINYNQIPLASYLNQIFIGKDQVQLTNATQSQAQTIMPDSKVKRQFKWEDDQRKWSWTLTLSQAGYDYFKSLARIPTDDYTVYVTNPADDIYLNSLVEQFRAAKTANNLSEEQMINLVVAFVQGIPYVEDKLGTGQEEYPKYPIETLYEQGGDCEDKSILMASLLEKLGYGAVLLVLPNHMAVGVKGSSALPGTYITYQNQRYYYLETTNSDWEIGDVPSEIVNSQAKILPLVPKSVLTHKWQSSGSLLNYRVTVTVTNHGTAEARNTKVHASFDAGAGNQVYSQQTSQILTIPAGGEAVYNINLRYPHRVKTRIHVRVSSNGIFQEESTSQWFTTK